MLAAVRDAWRYEVIPRTGWSSVIQLLGQVNRFHAQVLSVAARRIVQADTSLIVCIDEGR